MHGAEKCVWWERSARRSVRRVRGKCSWCGVSMCGVDQERGEN